MKKNQCKEALEIYKTFLSRMTKLSEFLKVAEVRSLCAAEASREDTGAAKNQSGASFPRVCERRRTEIRLTLPGLAADWLLLWNLIQWPDQLPGGLFPPSSSYLYL